MAIGIGLGMAEFPFSTARAFWRWVEQCEAGGVDSLWQTDRLVSKVPFLETMSTMAALAGATDRLKFGMNIASVGLRDPLLLAKQTAPARCYRHPKKPADAVPDHPDPKTQQPSPHRCKNYRSLSPPQIQAPLPAIAERCLHGSALWPSGFQKPAVPI
jgi:hypothetical protein